MSRPVSAQTVGKRIGFLRAAINFAKHRGHFSGENPAAGHDIDAWVVPVDAKVMPAKRPFNVGELNQLLRHPWFTGCRSRAHVHAPGNHRLTGMHYWVPITALLTGCRASELGGLKLSEVVLDDPHPHLRIRDNEYRRTKGGYARNVPVIDALMQLGFAEYVDRQRTSGSDRLFPDWKPPGGGNAALGDAQWSNGELLRAFNRTVIPAVFHGTLAKGARRELTFHSFREFVAAR